jgi:uncharacterized protein YukE
LKRLSPVWFVIEETDMSNGAGGLVGADLHGMQSAQTAIQDAIDNLQSLAQRLDSARDATHGGWQSKGADLMREVLLEFHNEYQSMVRDLQGILQNMGANQKGYAVSIDTETAGVQRLASLLGNRA